MPLNNSIFEVYSKQKDYNITFTHVPTDKSVSFPSFITSFSDAYNTNWSPETVYGRADAIQTFGGTSRKINFEFVVLANDVEEAKNNLNSLRLLGRMMYPTYTDGANATTISKAPLIRIKFANLVGRGQDNTGTSLLGVMSGFTISPTVEPGFFDPDARMLYAKEYTASVDFTVLHEENPGGWLEEPPPNPAPSEPPTGPDVKETVALWDDLPFTSQYDNLSGVPLGETACPIENNPEIRNPFEADANTDRPFGSYLLNAGGTDFLPPPPAPSYEDQVAIEQSVLQ
jgi:hypothetical protein